MQPDFVIQAATSLVQRFRGDSSRHLISMRKMWTDDGNSRHDPNADRLASAEADRRKGRYSQQITGMRLLNAK